MGRKDGQTDGQTYGTDRGNTSCPSAILRIDGGIKRTRMARPARELATLSWHAQLPFL